MPQHLVINTGGMLGNALPRRQPVAARPITRSPRLSGLPLSARLRRVTPAPRLLSPDEFTRTAIELANARKEMGVVLKRVDVINTMLRNGYPFGPDRDALTLERNKLSGTRRPQLTKWVALLERKFDEHERARVTEAQRKYGLI